MSMPLCARASYVPEQKAAVLSLVGSLGATAASGAAPPHRREPPFRHQKNRRAWHPIAARGLVRIIPDIVIAGPLCVYFDASTGRRLSLFPRIAVTEIKSSFSPLKAIAVSDPTPNVDIEAFRVLLRVGKAGAAPWPLCTYRKNTLAHRISASDLLGLPVCVAA